MLSRVLRVLSAIFLSLSLLTFAAAQTGRGIVTGRVVDSGGAVLPGAHVELQPGGITTVSNPQGEFSLSNVAAGDYTLTVTYVGFTAFSKQFTVAPGQAIRVDAGLKVASKSEEITVYSERAHGEAEALNVQRESDNILQVLPVEVITSLPNTNIADAVGRLPSVTLERDEGEGKYIQVRGAEPRYNNVTVDGVLLAAPEASVRQIKLDTMPANLIDSVEVNKTLSANQDGDAIGGSVNLVTKSAEERPTFYINGIGGYTPIIGGRSLTELDSYVGQRFGASKKLGILVGGSWDWNGRGINDVEPVPTAVGCGGGQCTDYLADQTAQAPFATSYDTQDIRDYRYNRTRYGYTGNIDYKLSDISGVYLRTLYSHFDNYGDRWVYSPTVGTFQTPTLTNNDGTMSFNVQARRPIDVIGSLQIGGKHEISPKWLLIWDAAVSRSSETDNGYSSANFAPTATSPLNNLTYVIDTNNHTPRLIPQGGVNIFDTTQYTLQDIDVNKTYSPQLNLETAVTASRTYNWNGHFGTLEFGGKFRNAHKFQAAFDPDYNYAGDPNAALLSSFQGSFTNSGYYDGAYPGAYTTPQADYGKVISFLNTNVSNAALFNPNVANTILNTYSNNFDIVERVGAFYAMNTLQFGRIRVSGGLRFEETTENLYAYTVGGGATLPDGSNTPITFSPLSKYKSYLDPLPSAQVRFALGQDSDIRVSYGRGISRPQFGDLPPSFGVSGLTVLANGNATPGQTISYGNPDLSATHSNNIDVLFEQYLKPFGIIEGGFFYKDISDPIYEGVKSLITQQTAQQNPLLAPYVGDFLAAPIQGTKAHLYGFEISYIQHLTFLPGFLNGFGLSANYSYTASKALGIPLRTDEPALQRQAPSTGNFSPTYDKGRFSARLGVSYNGPQVFQYAYQNLQATTNAQNQPVITPVQIPFGVKGPFGDTYLLQHTQVDAQASFRMYKGLQFIFSGLNLTNEVFGFYNGSPQFPIQREYYKPSYEFGLRYTLSGENK